MHVERKLEKKIIKRQRHLYFGTKTESESLK